MSVMWIHPIHPLSPSCQDRVGIMATDEHEGSRHKRPIYVTPDLGTGDSSSRPAQTATSRLNGAHKVAVMRHGGTALGPPLEIRPRVVHEARVSGRERSASASDSRPWGLTALSIALEVEQLQGAGRRSGGQRFRAVARKAEVTKDLPHDRGILDRREQTKPSAAVGAGKDVDLEGAP